MSMNPQMGPPLGPLKEGWREALSERDKWAAQKFHDALEKAKHKGQDDAKTDD